MFFSKIFYIFALKNNVMAIRTSEQLQAMFQASRERKEQERKHKEAQKRYRDKHKEQERLYFALYREKNKERLRAYQAEYRKREGNREKNILYQQIYRQTHKEIRVIDDETNTVKRVSETIELPPVKSKKQVKELYQKWLDNLKIRETYLTGIRLYFNQLMQKSIEEELSKRKK